ncbi:Phosphatidylinositide phosphatase SAC1 [Glycine soja]|uniref:Phosphatidylinositide phosphatase SAC1 n=1 Tax=Glycine soja TaxID=3848 RepID=A0A0B2QGG8_GLYSO|nr:Phosphatidylinositide phosphatase SAC1 [Glycine soja]
MWRRVANLEGGTANFIETEQFLENEEFKFSFLQHGEEGQLSAAYAAEMQNQQHVRYVPFDFHHHYGSSNFDNMKILYDQISEDFEKQRYFLIDRQGNILEEQRGLVRLNYIDSLDRTNVTQLYLFYLVWAEQGDEISLEYARTHALKGDLVRYGKQTITRMIKDGVSALSRYYLNNFQDGIRQANALRTNTSLKIFQILRPSQLVSFLVAVAELQIRIGSWGLDKDALNGGQG